MPYAVVGYALHFQNIKTTLLFSVISLLLYIVCNKYLTNSCMGFGYQGFELFFKTIFVFTSLNIFDNIVKNRSLLYNNLIPPFQYISSLTFGIYLIHVLVGRFIDDCYNRNNINRSTFFECIVIFTLCALIVYFNKYFISFKKKY